MRATIKEVAPNELLLNKLPHFDSSYRKEFRRLYMSQVMAIDMMKGGTIRMIIPLRNACSIPADDAIAFE